VNSERLLEHAREQGLTVTILKLGFLGPSALDGAWNTSDWLYALLQACRKAKTVYASPRETLLICVPGDLAALAIVKLCTDSATIGGNYVLDQLCPAGGVSTIEHLLHQTVARAELYNEAAGNSELEVEVLPFAGWLQRLQRELSGVEFLRAEAMFGQGGGAGSIGMVRHDSEGTNRVLASLGVVLQAEDGYWDQAIGKLTAYD
jgi:hypothetical protein